MGTFSISLPEDLQSVIDNEALLQHRSRSAQVLKIIEEWIDNLKPETPRDPSFNEKDLETGHR
jgi:hypothetical protein